MLVFFIVILLLAALLEYVSLRSGTSCVDVDFRLSDVRTEPEAPIELTSVVSNHGRLPITYLALTFAFPLAASLPEHMEAHKDLQFQTIEETYRLWGRQSVERWMQFSIKNRGVYTVSGKQIGRGDFLGIRTQRAYLDVRRSVLVYPRRLENADLVSALGAISGDMAAERWLLRDPILTLGVREYTGNEPMHTISWSQTAWRGELTVREFDYTRSLNCCVLFCVNGFSHDETQLLDLACSAARTICDTLNSHGVDVQLFTNAALFGFARAPYRFATASANRQEEVLEILARATSAPCLSAAEFADACCAAAPDAAAYLLLVPHISKESDRAYDCLLRRTGMAPVLIAADSLEVPQNG